MINLGSYTDMMYIAAMDEKEREELDGIWQAMYARLLDWA